MRRPCGVRARLRSAVEGWRWPRALAYAEEDVQRGGALLDAYAARERMTLALLGAAGLPTDVREALEALYGRAL